MNTHVHKFENVYRLKRAQPEAGAQNFSIASSTGYLYSKFCGNLIFEKSYQLKRGWCRARAPDMTYLYDLFICVAWILVMCAMTHAYVWHEFCYMYRDSYTSAIWIFCHTCHDSFICVTWSRGICAMTHSSETCIYFWFFLIRPVETSMTRGSSERIQI